MFFPNADIIVNPLLLVLLGVIVGTLGGFFGVGGGFLITGGLLVFGVPPLFAVGTGLTLVMGSSIINMLKHRGMGNVDFKLGLIMVCGTVPAEILAENLNSVLDQAGIAGPVISYVFIVFLTTLGIFIIYDFLKTSKQRKHGRESVSTANLALRVQALRIPPHSIKIPGLRPFSTYVTLPLSRIESISVFIPLTIGFGIGFLAGLLGAGGGFILMPLLVYVVGIPTTVAIGTDLFQIIITGSVGTFIYSLGNHVDPLMAIVMLIAASLGSQLGAGATRLVDPSRIRVLFGITVLSGSVAIGLKQISSFTNELGFLSDIASIVLLGVSGLIALIICFLLVKANLTKN
ncbi:MAG: sulfite exporter TauE/SafE family protein [Chloroflexota bacterium]|nr:sulfite exporter TauE/SafE family protein [Chloroflexota bacterium]